MLTNSQMKPKRWVRLHRANTIHKAINRALLSGRVVYVTTCTKSTRFKGQKYLPWFRPTQSGLLMLSGGKWVSIEHASVSIAAK